MIISEDGEIRGRGSQAANIVGSANISSANIMGAKQPAEYHRPMAEDAELLVDLVTRVLIAAQPEDEKRRASGSRPFA